MNQKIKESYSKIQITEDAKEHIYQQILQTDNTPNEELRKHSRKPQFSGWKPVIAICLCAILLIPASVYAAGKLSAYIAVMIDQNNYQTQIKFHRTEDAQNSSGATATGMPTAESEKADMPYIQIKTNFGSDYKLDQIFDGTYYYKHTDSTDTNDGKDFHYGVIYIDADSEEVLNLYNQESVEELEVNGHRALFSKYLMVPKGSRYTSDYDDYATLDLYVFYEEPGYIINYACSPELGKDRLLALAEQVTVTKATRKNAVQYTLLSDLSTVDAIKPDNTSDNELITPPIKDMNETIEHSGCSYQVTDVNISSSISDRNMDHYYLLDSVLSLGLWNKKGKLKSYVRETIQYGDGISEPETSVTGEEKIQLVMVNVTMKVKATEHDVTIELPTIKFFKKEGQNYYDFDTKHHRQYNRPLGIECALVDSCPCYFKETEGDEMYLLKTIRKGEEQTYHFAYFVDEDMTDMMYLKPYSINDDCPYINISQ